MSVISVTKQQNTFLIVDSGVLGEHGKKLKITSRYNLRTCLIDVCQGTDALLKFDKKNE